MRRTILVLAAVLTACAIPVDQEPRVLEVEDLPDAVTTSRPDAAGEPLVLWFVEGSALAPLAVNVPDVDPSAILTVLIGGPPSEAAGDLRSAIPPETRILGVVVDDGVAVVDLSRSFTLVGGDEEILAVGQVVLSLTELEGIAGVRLLIDGTPVSAPVAEGALVDRPLTPDDFASPIGG